ncbi:MULTISPECIES: PLP-dependent aminotransferase family protein [unclassified Pseudomonas]|uniref:aminotransferase-like domain-containing protein n=1 Tax=unclassified Pseudomonas TaxID=196821 RepID=UPI000C886BCB|nr:MULTISPECIES: PLP-dependent aminotransferase family protein [unclassified Pseudomonas]PMX28790.1 GntR family transcriptional regulator [Pseudomonas sp. GW460-12]PMX36080.1 GntR family transcriptional regulator [Pseudomonas sp. MPR-R2A4]PMX40826.1 GntR family transcriptional regulator [Pseudomonas sp. MPR-R2A7]PMX52406.1 GntR family transcriptional regulator [Pseudomonas sp. MPR-R2A6]PMX90423.1 GntR family transcriptional regulator [Pseudomonas sp. MPR-R2A3]
MDKPKDASFAYQSVYRYLVEWIEASPSQGERKLPSLRHLAQRLGVSVSTTKYAYSLLEDQERIYAKPKSGYFTRWIPAPLSTEHSPNLLDQVFANARQPGMLALSSDAPAMLLSLENPLLMIEREIARQYPRSLTPLYLPFGEPELRTALAERYTCSTAPYWQAEQVYIGSDLHTVLDVSLSALELRGTVALVESPCSWAILRQLQAANIRVIEVPLGADGRFNMPAFHELLKQEPIRLAVLSSTVNIPQGGVVPAQDKQQVCRWLAERDIWLFENDTYGELYFEPRPARYRDYADPQRLVVFSTFDKVIGSEAPYGYVLCRGQAPHLQRLFMERGFRLSPIRQKAIAKLLTSKRLDQHLVMLRAALLERMTRMKALLEALGEWQVVEPSGGASFWLQTRRTVDMRWVFEHLLAQRIVIAPGELFSQQGTWKQSLRLSYTLDWSKDIAQAVRQLAQAIRQSP